MPYSVQKSFNFPYGHRLSKHKGLCKNIHGHNAKLDVKISTERLNKNDMVIDFSDLKKIVGELTNRFDHAFFANSKDKKTVDTVRKIQEKGKLILTMNTDPTSEYLCMVIYEEIQSEIEKIDLNLKVEYVRLWESDGSMAEYRPDDLT